jgi:peptidoglycan hydrolase CwlO-like protein
MEQEFLNSYIENMSKKITELTKNEILLATHLEMSQKAISRLSEENSSLQQKIQKLENRKINKKGVDTPEENIF